MPKKTTTKAKKSKTPKGTDVDFSVGNIVGVKTKGASNKTLLIIGGIIIVAIFFWKAHYSKTTNPNGTQTTDFAIRKAHP